MADYVGYENFYNGGISSMSSSYGLDNRSFTGYRMNAAGLGFPGSVQTANQLGEAVNAIKQGVKAFEVTLGQAGSGQAGPAEQVPIQHFDEMRALLKISGVSPSVHAPFDLDPSGIGQQGFEESNRVENERRLFAVLEKASKLKDEGNVPVVFHSSGGLPATEYRPGDEKKGEERWHVREIPLVNRETGQVVTKVKEERKIELFNPQDFEKGGTMQNPLEDINRVNRSIWNQTMTELAQQKKMGDEVLGSSSALLADMANVKVTKENQGEILQSLEPGQRAAYNRMADAEIFIHNAQMKLNSAIETAYKYGSGDQKKEIKELAENFNKGYREAAGTFLMPIKNKALLDQSIMRLEQITEGKRDPRTGEIKGDVPQIVMPVEDFAREKASETFSNLALKSYNTLGGEKAPIIAVENMFAG